jgi:hypothetical protein
MNHPEVTQKALDILRSGANFQWAVIPLLAFVVYIYANEASKKNWNGIAAGLALYMVHWFYEILNGLIQHFSGHALWTVPTGTSFLILGCRSGDEQAAASRSQDEDPGDQ